MAYLSCPLLSNILRVKILVTFCRQISWRAFDLACRVFHKSFRQLRIRSVQKYWQDRPVTGPLDFFDDIKIFCPYTIMGTRLIVNRVPNKLSNCSFCLSPYLLLHGLLQDFHPDRDQWPSGAVFPSSFWPRVIVNEGCRIACDIRQRSFYGLS